MKNFSIACCLVIVVSYTFPQSAYLQVDNPQSAVWSETGTIEDASLLIKPHGSYSLQDLELSFSSRNTHFLASESLEVTLNFSLPEGSFITDLWLWIDSIPAQALIVDRGKARATYDNIVKRIRKDPAILENIYGDYYRLQIYPLVGNNFRKIRLSYYSPYNSSAIDSLSLSIPVWIINASKELVPVTNVIIQKNTWRQDPKIIEHPDVHFNESADSLLGTVYSAALSGELLREGNGMTLGFGDSFNRNYFFLEKYGGDGSGTYNLRVLPNKNLELHTGRKLLFLIDHDSLRAWQSKQSIHDQLISTLAHKLLPNDSINLIMSSRKGFIYAAPGWMPCDTVSLRTVMDNIMLPDVLDTVNLGSLLFEGVKFLNTIGKENASLVVIASSHQFGSLSSSNTVYDSLSKISAFDVPMYVLNYGNYYDYNNWFIAGGEYYYGNQYLYRLISLTSKGNYWFWNSWPNAVENLIDEIRGFIEYFDVTTYLQNGFTYEKINSPITSKLPVYNYFSQSGKYSGNFPLMVELTGKYRGTVYHKKLVLEDSLTYQSDSTLTKYTAYQQIKLLRNDYTQASKDRIVEMSLENRILTEYTAFLALEPGQKLCDTCVTGGQIVVTYSVDERSLPSTYEILQAYPNPFNPSTRIRIRLPHNVESKNVTVQIYNVLGQLVRNVDPSGLTADSYKEIEWNGTDDSGRKAATGVYLVVLSTPIQRYTLKLILMK